MRASKKIELEEKISSFQLHDLTPLKQNSRFLKIVPYQVRLKDGTTFVREKIVKNSQDGRAVIIMALTTDDEVLFVVEPRVFTEEGVGVGLPAGYIEPGEKIEDAVTRELLEETGYSTSKINILGSFYQDEGCSSALNYGVIAINCKKVSCQHLDTDEHIEVFRCNLSEAYELLETGVIRGANSCLTMMLAKEYMKK